MRYFKIIVPKEARDMMLVCAKDKKEAWAIMQKQFEGYSGGLAGWNRELTAFGYEEFAEELAPTPIDRAKVEAIIMQSKGGWVTVGKTKGWRK